MAFESENLSVLTFANSFTLWHYTTDDTLVDVDTAGYFDDAADMLRVGDMVIVNIGHGRFNISGAAILLCRANHNGAAEMVRLVGVA